MQEYTFCICWTPSLRLKKKGTDPVFQWCRLLDLVLCFSLKKWGVCPKKVCKVTFFGAVNSSKLTYILITPRNEKVLIKSEGHIPFCLPHKLWESKRLCSLWCTYDCHMGSILEYKLKGFNIPRWGFLLSPRLIKSNLTKSEVCSITWRESGIENGRGHGRANWKDWQTKPAHFFIIY